MPQAPSEEELASALVFWEQLIEDLERDFGLAVNDWHSYSRKAGWSLRVKKGDRNIVDLSPGAGAFMASFALGEKAMAAVRQEGRGPARCEEAGRGQTGRLRLTTAANLYQSSRVPASRASHG